jgi:hypothetical protein
MIASAYSRISAHHRATAALHRSYAAVVGLPEEAAAHEDAATRFESLADSLASLA